MNSPSYTFPPSPLEHAARRLLLLAQGIARVDTAFITSIDWSARSQRILFASNQGALQVAEGSVLDWNGPVCRHLRLSGVAPGSSLANQVVATPWAVAKGIQGFFALPIVVDDIRLGTLCGASRQAIELDPAQLAALRLIAEALQSLLALDRATAGAHARADAAELDAAEARSATTRQAIRSQQLERMAYTDALTGLPNRRAFMARWESELARSTRRGYAIGLVLLDADRFKAVNDSAGHAMGDAVLRAIGATLMVAARSPDFVARLGGDEFALLSIDAGGAHLEHLARKIAAQFQIVAAELGVDTTLSLGMVSSEQCPRERMFADADQALYRSKDAGGNASRMFSCDAPAAPKTSARAPAARLHGSAMT
jgi:diguanylate cyclase